jgi:hypothetical protein
VWDKLQQESRFLDRPGFRIKCGMTALEGYLTERDLKKQSQFAPARIGAKSFVEGDYGNKAARGAEKNKPKQSQFQANSNACPFNGVYPERSRMGSEQALRNWIGRADRVRLE